MNVIWNDLTIALNELNALTKGNMGEYLAIEFTEIGPNYLKASMPVNEKTRQPYGLLHGGASAVLAETVGSVASSLVIDRETQLCVGIEINCNHLRGKRDGIVTATVEPLHIGATTHVWDIRLRDEQDKMICVSRLTVAVLTKKDKSLGNNRI
jgi:1,4-dihydroxy-2-naphthoyl-CoA hydrolase